MSAKRACMVRTSSVSKIEQVQPIESHSEKRKIPVSSFESVQRPTKNNMKRKVPVSRQIFTSNNVVSSPHSRRTGLVGRFLESCFFCKKKFSEEDDIFMYRNFCAFCSPECRENQMALDMKEAEEKSTAKKAA